MKIIVAIGCDHAGYELKASVLSWLQSKGVETIDFGTSSLLSVDYPDFAHEVGHAIQTGRAEIGIVICGSGNGVNMTVNKYSKVRSALCWNKEIASLARQHNNANVLALPARYITVDEVIEMLEVFFTTAFEGGRHHNRVNKIFTGIKK
ncbi:MAG: ribose 5-phosphate isomerase B [Bacteroidetes bacterium]|nr:ribose 5-phosphate isomerase B [Bacteroidota bacterium]MBU1720676.1 ribose 5-phosphate isomerase B [Bacteroidota bacterium]